MAYGADARAGCGWHDCRRSERRAKKTVAAPCVPLRPDFPGGDGTDLGELRQHSNRTPARRASRLDSDTRDSIFRRYRRAWLGDDPADGGRGADGPAGVAERRRESADLFCAVPFSAGGAVRDLHGSQLFSLVYLLGAEPHPGVLPDQAVGRAATQRCGDAILHLHDGWERDVVAVVPGHLSGCRHVRLPPARRTGPERRADLSAFCKAGLV